MRTGRISIWLLVAWILATFLGVVWLSADDEAAISLAARYGWILEDSVPGGILVTVSWLFAVQWTAPLGIMVAAIEMVALRKKGERPMVPAMAAFLHALVFAPWLLVAMKVT